MLTIINRLDEYIEGTSSKEYIKNIVLYIVHAHTNNPPISNLLHCFDFIIKSLSKSKQSETIQNPKKEKNLSDELTDLGLVKKIMTILCETNVNPKLYKKALKLSVKMLKKGSFSIQGKFYEFFINSDMSENFFSKINFLIKNTNFDFF